MNEKPFPSDLVKSWLLRAKSSYEMAKVSTTEVLYEDRCYALQQAAEKAIKAIFISIDEKFPYTHDISFLLRNLKSEGIQIPTDIQKSGLLTTYATQTRYPGLLSPVLEEEFLNALLITERILSWAEEVILKNEAE